jgi:undecaprenyl diphosphate synthase
LLAERVALGELKPADIDHDAFEAMLDTGGVPDPDLILRTSGEQRISNFLLWQGAYSELVFLPVLWPEFGDEQFEAALDEFACRERRYGGLVERSG